MPDPSDVYGFDRYTLGASPLANVTATLQLSGTDDPEADPQYLDRAGQPAQFVQSVIEPNELSVLFRTRDYAGQNAVLQMLDFPAQDERTLRAYRGDPAAPVLCEADVAVKRISKRATSDVTVLFERADPAWRATVESSPAIGTVYWGSTSAVTLINRGQLRAAPFFKLGWLVQRAVFTFDVGWRFRRQVVITNATEEDWEDELITVDAGATDAWVTAGEARSDGNDVRVWFEGREVYRTLAGFNTKKTLMHFLVGIKAGESATFDVVYGNSAAHAPRDLSTRTGTRKTYAAPDLEGYAGTATAGTTGTLTDGGATWETNRWAGGWIGLVSGTGSTRWRRILSNTGTVITFNRALVTAADATTKYVIFMSGILFDGGRVTGGVTSTAFQDTGHTRKWGVNQLVGATITFIGGSGATPSTVTVKSNTTDTITTNETFTVNPSVNDQFTIQRQGVWSYVVDTAINNSLHRGVARENHYYEMPTRSWPNGDTPAGWQIETYLPNDDNYAVYPPYNVGSGGGHAANWWTLPRGIRRVNQDAALPGQGDGDGWSLFSAIGFQGWYLDYQMQNQNGIGKVVFSSLDAGGGDWQDLVTDTTTRAGLTNVAAQHIDLTSANYPTRLFMGVLPADGVLIPTSATATDKVELRTNDSLEVYHYLEAFGGLSSSTYSLGSKVECYELACSLRIGGGRDAERTPPFDEIVIGGDGHRVMLPTGYELWITTDPAPGQPLFAVYDSFHALQYEAAWAGVFYRHIRAADGSDLAIPSTEFVPIPPALNLVPNGYFGTDIAGWTVTPSAGVTVTPSRKATPDAGDGIGTGSLELDISATPAGAWTITCTIPTIAVTPGENYPVGCAARATNIGSSLAITLTAQWEGGVGGDPNTVLNVTPSAINTWTYKADDEVTYEVPPGTLSVYGSTDVVDIAIVVSGTGSYVGKVYLDQVTLGVPNLHMTQINGGTASVAVSWVERYL